MAHQQPDRYGPCVHTHQGFLYHCSVLYPPYFYKKSKINGFGLAETREIQFISNNENMNDNLL